MGIMDNKKFWEKQAEKYGNDVYAINFDAMEENLEFFFIDKLIDDNIIVSDIGCGNGRTLVELAQHKKNTIFYGTDFSTNMISVANRQKEKLGLQNVHFQVADVTAKDFSSMLPKSDIVLTKRVLINIHGKNKTKAINNIYSLLVDGGKYIMIE